MKIAVIGGGIFGVTTAIHLSKNHQVDLFEKNPDILQAASGINQYRLHRGYHYPRSDDTAISANQSEIIFKKKYAKSIINDVDHFYCIAKNNSLTTKDQYINFCNKIGLPFQEINLGLINEKEIELCVKVNENLINPFTLKEICWRELRNNNVKVFTNKSVYLENLDHYDYVVIATYANFNQTLNNFSDLQIDCQFEICEKPVVKLPLSFNKKSIVVMDGPFMCIDPFGDTNNFVLGNVVHAIHHSNTGKIPEIPKKFDGLLNNGIIKNPSITNFELFKSSGTNFIPLLSKAEHLGSMFTIRTVLPNLESTDARPTIVRKLKNNVISIFSGKLGNCVDASLQVEEIIDN
tara:strand:+ start:206 stop:1252 length:1047 start_codon:yes stop_codon:yes gene_type:complete